MTPTTVVQTGPVPRDATNAEVAALPAHLLPDLSTFPDSQTAYRFLLWAVAYFV